MVEDAREDTGGVEVREAAPINRPVDPHESHGMEVADNAVVADRLISSQDIFSSSRGVVPIGHDLAIGCGRIVSLIGRISAAIKWSFEQNIKMLPVNE